MTNSEILKYSSLIFICEIHDCIYENYMQYRNGELTLPDNTTMYDAFITAITPKD